MPSTDGPGWDGTVTADETLGTLPPHVAAAFDTRYASPSERAARAANELFPGVQLLPPEWIEQTYR